MKNRPITQAGRRERGNTLVEFALSFALLFTVFTGVFRFGYVYYLYNRLESSVRGGARYGSLRAYDSATATPSGGYQTAVQNMAVYGNPDGAGQPAVPGLTSEKISVTIGMERNVPRQVTLAVTNLQIDAVFASFTLNDKPKITFPYMGRFAP